MMMNDSDDEFRRKLIRDNDWNDKMRWTKQSYENEWNVKESCICALFIYCCIEVLGVMSEWCGMYSHHVLLYVPSILVPGAMVS